MTRSEHPRLCWLIEHLPDLVLFVVALPTALVALALHFV